MSAARRDLAIGFTLLLAVSVVPWLTDLRYIVTQTTLLFLWATVVVQWNLVFGVAGIFSLAQMALFAVGGYATAMLGYYLAWPLWLATPVAALITVAVSTLIGLACLRLKGAYVALLTLAIAQVMYVYVVTDTDCFRKTAAGCEQLFGGTTGLKRFGDLGFRDWLGGDWFVGHYYVALLILAAAMLFSVVLIRGPVGLAFQALRDNPGYAVARGVSRFRSQLWVFALSAFFTGLAGSFYAVQLRVIGPTVFSSSQLLFLLAMLVVGGVGTIWGPILGAVLLMFADEGLKEVGEWRNIGLGLIIALFAILLPQGLAGLGRQRGRRSNQETP